MIGVPITFAAWMLLKFVSYEEASEQGMAVSAGRTMAGSTFAFGVIPLVLIHLIGFVILCALGALGRIGRAAGAALGAAPVLGTSLVSLSIVLILSDGHLLASAEYIP